MEYYIFNDDEFGSMIYDELILKAHEGVKIKIIIDGIGTKILKRKRLRELEKLGFKGVYVPEANRKEIEKKEYKLKLIYLKNLEEFLERM